MKKSGQMRLKRWVINKMMDNRQLLEELRVLYGKNHVSAVLTMIEVNHYRLVDDDSLCIIGLYLCITPSELIN